MKRGLTKRPETAVEVFKLLPEGVHCQVINNVIYMSPAPTFQHQDIIAEIAMRIRMYVKKRHSGTCVTSPVDVFLDKDNAFQPDILYISKSRMNIVGKDGKLYGAPDMVIEVLSPNNENDDKVKKRDVYESSGVKEYFIVDPSGKEVISYYLVRKKFESGPVLKGKITSRMLKKTFSF